MKLGGPFDADLWICMILLHTCESRDFADPPKSISKYSMIFEINLKNSARLQDVRSMASVLMSHWNHFGSLF